MMRRIRCCVSIWFWLDLLGRTESLMQAYCRRHACLTCLQCSHRGGCTGLAMSAGWKTAVSQRTYYVASLIPRSSSFWSRRWCGTVSKALLKSSTSASTSMSCLRSVLVRRSRVVTSSCDLHECLLRNLWLGSVRRLCMSKLALMCEHMMCYAPVTCTWRRSIVNETGL